MKRGSLLRFSWLALLCSFFTLQPVVGQTLKRTIELRDGTILQANVPDEEIPWRNVTVDGMITEQPIELSQVKKLSFSASPATKEVAKVRRLLNLLGSESYAEREHAQDELIDNGSFIEIIKQYETEDREIQWRLEWIKKAIIESADDKSTGLINNQFDNLVLKDQTTLDGDTNDWQVRANYAGQELTFDRKTVLELNDEKPKLDFGEDESGSVVVRVPSLDPIHPEGQGVKPGYVQIDFDFAQDGAAVNTKQMLQDLFVYAGCKFRSEFSDSSIVAFRYNCRGRSSELCAGNLAPAYGGVMRIDFCIPGKANMPAGVKFVGFYISAVKPDGTTVEAYNGFGQLITTIKTTKSGAEFMAIESSQPIAWLRIVPNVEIDEDYAIDDLYFDIPRPLVEGGDPDKNTLVLKNGDRLQSNEATIKDSSIRLEELTFTDKPLEFPINQVAVFIPRKPAQPRLYWRWKPRISPDTTFIQLKNGNVLAATIGKDGIVAKRFANAVKRDELVAFWSQQQGRKSLPPNTEIPQGGGLLLLPAETQSLPDVAFSEEWITSTGFAERPDIVFSYGDSPTVYLNPPDPVPPKAGVIRTMGGETIWLSKESGARFNQLTESGVEIEFAGKQIVIPIAEINTLRLPQD